VSDEANKWERRLERERKARNRAEELLENRSRELYEAQGQLQEAYVATVEVFSNLFITRRGREPETLRKLGRTVKAFAKYLNYKKDTLDNLKLAALLCDIGKLALPDEILSKPLSKLSKKEYENFIQHPIVSYDSLAALPPLAPAAEIILQHCELFDGKGYPNRLAANEISNEAQLLGIVKDFDALLRGRLVEDVLTATEAIDYIQSHINTRYEEQLAKKFIEFIEQTSSLADQLEETRLTPASLKPGLVLSRDLNNNQGIMILPAGQELTAVLIDKLQNMAQSRNDELLLYVESQDLEDEDEAEGEGEGENTDKNTDLPTNL